MLVVFYNICMHLLLEYHEGFHVFFLLHSQLLYPLDILFILGVVLLITTPVLSETIFFLLSVLVPHVPLIYIFLPLMDPISPAIGYFPLMVSSWMSCSRTGFLFYIFFMTSLFNALDLYRSHMYYLIE